MAVIAVFALLATGCGGDDGDAGAEVDASTDGSGSVTNEDVDSDESSGDESEQDTSSADAGGGGGGSVVLGDETIGFDRALCFLEEQDAAAGGGKILFTAQAFGANSDGDEVSIDVSRFDEDSQFTGDDISVVVGDPFSGDAVSWDASVPIGTVAVDGSSVSAGDLIFVNGDDLSERPGSFEINC